jgi:Flp pilus assembly secretin CpaC
MTTFPRPRYLAIAPLLGIATAVAILGSVAAQAETLRVTLNKAEVITLNGSPAVVMVANPQIADVVLERNNLLFVLGKQPGETRLYVYNGAGKPMLEREVIVVPQGDRTVTITRDVQSNEYSCAPRCVSLDRRAAAPTAAPAAAAP